MNNSKLAFSLAVNSSAIGARLRLCALSLMIVGVPFCPAASEFDLDLQIVGGWTDPLFTSPDGDQIMFLAAPDGTHVYCAMGQCGLVVVNTTTAGLHQTVGRYLPSGVVYGVWLGNGLAFVAVHPSGLHLVDFTEPSNPKRVGLYPIQPVADTPGAISGVATAGRYAIVGSRQQGALVLDLADPAQPGLVATYSAAGHDAVSVAGEHLYLLTDGYFRYQPTRLDVVDFSRPANLTCVGSYAPADEWRHWHDLKASGTDLLVAGDDGLEIFDARNPSELRKLGEKMVAWGGAWRIATAGRYACLSAYYFEEGMHLEVVDFSNRAQPQFVGNGGEKGGGLAAHADRVYVGSPGGFNTIGLARRANPARIAVHKQKEGISAIAVADPFAYLACHRGMVVLEISNPLFPRQLGTYGTNIAPSSLAVSANYAFIGLDPSRGDGNGSDLLHIVDIRNPTNPVYAGSYRGNRPSRFIRNLALGADHLYLTAYEQQWSEPLHVLDIADPMNPRTAAVIGGVYGLLAFSKPYLFATTTNGLTVFDVSQPDQPKPAGQFTCNGIYDMKLVENRLYLLDDHWDDSEGLWRARMFVLDVSDPANLRQLAAVDLPTWSRDFVVVGDFLYVLGNTLDVMDIRDLSHPQRVGGNSAFHWAPDMITVGGGKLLVGGNDFSGGATLDVLNLAVPFRWSHIRSSDARLGRFQLSGPEGWPVNIQHSANLETWQHWDSVTLGVSPIELKLVDGSPDPARFFRAVVPLLAE